MNLQEAPELRTARKVLAIDDEVSYCLWLANMISGLGYKVMTSSQAESVYLDQKNEQDVIFIDMMIPEMDGLEVLDEISIHNIQSSITNERRTIICLQMQKHRPNKET